MTMGPIIMKHISPYFSAISEDYQNMITQFGQTSSSQTHPASHMNDIGIEVKLLQTPFRSLILSACYTKLMNRHS
jgi:hypothetical protein